ncbi:MAG: FHA domain-containing protein, partial [Planctomycetes bacterium]|nr:FHA domain-containing protein [Planctomycetota bacterium]
MPRLVIFQDDGRGGVFELTDEATVGRSSDNTIPLIGGKQISRTHARFVRRGEKFYIKDTGSRNGVFVNGRKIVEHPLARGDKIEIGSAMLVFDPEFDLHTREGTEGSLVVLPAVDT